MLLILDCEERETHAQMNKEIGAAKECFACPCLNVKIVIDVIDHETSQEDSTNGILEQDVTISPGTDSRITVVSAIELFARWCT